MGSENTRSSYEGNYTTGEDNIWIWVAFTTTIYQLEGIYITYTCGWDVEKGIKSVPVIYSYLCLRTWMHIKGKDS